MEFRGFHCHFHGVFGLHFHFQWKFSAKLSDINFLRFLLVSMDSTDNFCGIHGAIGLHFHGIHPMLSIDVHATMDAMEGHGRGGILQNSTEAMELDLFENWYKLLRKWPQDWNLHFKYNIYHKYMFNIYSWAKI